MFSHLVVPLDGSPLAEGALPVALALAERFGSTLTLLRVVDAPVHGLLDENDAHDELLNTIHDSVYNQCQDYLKTQYAELTAQGARIEVHIAEQEESVAHTILQVTAKLGADGIVMSTHGRGGISRLVFGSVAEKILRLASVPVVLIPAKALKMGA